MYSVVSLNSSPPTLFFFFFNDTATTEIYTLSLHDALPISCHSIGRRRFAEPLAPWSIQSLISPSSADVRSAARSEEHTSELQSRSDLVCRLLLEKKKKKINVIHMNQVDTV